MGCLGTNLCEIATGNVTLEDGSVVCNACPLWREECEVKRVLTYPLHERRQAIEERTKIRGNEVMDKFKELMKVVHAKEKRKREAAQDRAKEARKIIDGQDS